MKYICTILTLIIIILSGIPCSDSQTGISKTPTISLSDSGLHQQHAKDACSPFCICNCCRTIPCLVLDAQVPNEASISLHFEKKQPNYVSIVYSRFHGSIWQPPKIS